MATRDILSATDLLFGLGFAVGMSPTMHFGISRKR